MNVIEIPLSQGKVALISSEDLALIAPYTWYAAQTAEKTPKFYARAHDPATGKKIYMHRLINQTPEGFDTDHIDGDSLNNTRDNLRTVTVSQNLLNRPKMNIEGALSKYKGVSQDKRNRPERRWIARLAHSVAKRHGVSQHIGSFATEEEAARAYDECILKLHPEYSVLNFPEAN